MQMKAVHTLLLGILSWNIFIVQTHVVDDRIVFPNDNNESTTTTTELPTLDNRILVDTLPKCPTGQKLYAGRCRFSA
ncbi:hypothetical protein AWZ03_002869 [Drosophila navojoa]|uniref:Kazal-like domain-containing protein n=1 Tax=Drosophila navojoa TaxID=7232 RepID=A0A484BRW1_DRONA|nr:uncharacterized protein LOC115561865 [Drosophila navojoa]TDG50565.1 hypothetical protein AWZ03_002869 [Drosophila navojoa]